MQQLACMISLISASAVPQLSFQYFQPFKKKLIKPKYK